MSQMNGDTDPQVEAAVRVDPNLLKALDMLRQMIMSGRCIGLVCVGLTSDGNAFNLSSTPQNAQMLRLAVGQCFDLMQSLNEEARRLSQKMPTSPIIRPPIHMGG